MPELWQIMAVVAAIMAGAAVGLVLGRCIERLDQLDAIKSLADTATELHEQLEACAGLLNVRNREIEQLRAKNAELEQARDEISKQWAPLFEMADPGRRRVS